MILMGMRVAFQHIFYDPTNIPTWTLERIRNVWLTLKSLLTWHYPLFWIRIMSCSRYNDVAWTWYWYDWSASNSFLFHVCYQHFIIMWWWCRCQLQNWHMRYVYLSSWSKISVVNSTSIQNLIHEHTPSRYVSILAGLLK